MESGTFTSRVTHTRRKTLSGNGNPRITVTFANGMTFDTETDGSVNYAIENREFRDNDSVVTIANGKIKYIRLA